MTCPGCTPVSQPMPAGIDFSPPVTLIRASSFGNGWICQFWVCGVITLLPSGKKNKSVYAALELGNGDHISHQPRRLRILGINILELIFLFFNHQLSPNIFNLVSSGRTLLSSWFVQQHNLSCSQQLFLRPLESTKQYVVVSLILLLLDSPLQIAWVSAVISSWRAPSHSGSSCCSCC